MSRLGPGVSVNISLRPSHALQGRSVRPLPRPARPRACPPPPPPNQLRPLLNRLDGPERLVALRPQPQWLGTHDASALGQAASIYAHLGESLALSEHHPPGSPCSLVAHARPGGGLRQCHVFSMRTDPRSAPLCRTDSSSGAVAAGRAIAVSLGEGLDRRTLSPPTQTGFLYASKPLRAPPCAGGGHHAIVLIVSDVAIPADTLTRPHSLAGCRNSAVPSDCAGIIAGGICVLLPWYFEPAGLNAALGPVSLATSHPSGAAERGMFCTARAYCALRDVAESPPTPPSLRPCPV